MPQVDAGFEFREAARRPNGPGPLPFSSPSAEEPTDDDQLAEMIRIVVRYEQRFPENGVSIAVRNWRKQIRHWVGYEILHCL